MVDEASKDNDDTKQTPQFLEVKCSSSGKIKRFAFGTKAGFALSFINSKLEVGAPLSRYIQAIKDGEEEEPVVFGPNAALTDFGSGWKLQTVAELDHPGFRKQEGDEPIKTSIPPGMGVGGSQHLNKSPKLAISYVYFAKILVAFILMFLLAAIFVLALESLPRMILFINSLIYTGPRKNTSCEQAIQIPNAAKRHKLGFANDSQTSALESVSDSKWCGWARKSEMWSALSS
ncbi:hypothetical protein ACFE04_028078 [Oxalis oulophora]